MSLIGGYLTTALGFFRRNRDQNLQWQLSRQQDVAELRRQQALAEQQLAAELSKRAQQLAHELAVGEARQANELAMVKIQCQQELKDYQHYLQSLDTLKDSLRHSYAHLPEAVAFTIHHHAKQLLNQMWDAGDEQEKMKAEMQLLRFMTAVHEDSQAALNSQQALALPEKTMAFLDSDAG